MTSDPIRFCCAAVGGGALGYVFSALLWAGVRNLPSFRYPVGLVLGGFVGRVFLAVAGFFAILQFAGWVGTLVALACFTIGRSVFTRLHIEPSGNMATSTGMDPKS